MKLGCQASRARWRRLSSERLTLLGIRSLLTTSDISRISRKGPEREAAWAPRYSRPTPVELRPLRLPIERERAALADGVGALEDPVLPGGEAAEDLRLERLRAAEAEAGLHARHGIGRHAGALFERDPHFVFPIDIVGRERDEAGFHGVLRADGPLHFEHARHALRLAEEARLKAREAVRHRERAGVHR